MFVKVEVPEALSGISRFNGHVDRIFSALSDLVQGDYESEKCRIALRSLIKPAFENISVILNKIRSLFLALYHITHASMPFAKKMARSEQHCIYAIQTVINLQTKEIYERMSKANVKENESFTLNDIINFIGSVEQGTATCKWTSAKQLPREISLLGFSRIQLNASTDLAINMSRMGVNGKQDESNKYSSSDKYKRMRGKGDITKEETKLEDLHSTRNMTKRDLIATMAEEKETQDNTLVTEDTPGAPETKETQEDPEN